MTYVPESVRAYFDACAKRDLSGRQSEQRARTFAAPDPDILHSQTNSQGQPLWLPT